MTKMNYSMKKGLIDLCCEIDTVLVLENTLAKYRCHACVEDITINYIDTHHFIDVYEDETNEILFRLNIAVDDYNVDDDEDNLDGFTIKVTREE